MYENRHAILQFLPSQPHLLPCHVPMALPDPAVHEITAQAALPHQLQNEHSVPGSKSLTIT